MLNSNHGKKFFGFGKNVFVAICVSFFMDNSSEMIYPLVPLFLANVLGVTACAGLVVLDFRTDGDAVNADPLPPGVREGMLRLLERGA